MAVQALLAEFQRQLSGPMQALAVAAEALAAEPTERVHSDPYCDVPGESCANWLDAVEAIYDLLNAAGRHELPEVVSRSADLEFNPAADDAWWLIAHYHVALSQGPRCAVFGRMQADPAFRRAVAATFAPGGHVYNVVVPELIAVHGPGYHDRLAKLAAIAGVSVEGAVERSGLAGLSLATARRVVGQWAWAKQSAELWAAAGLDGIGLATLPPADEPPPSTVDEPAAGPPDTPASEPKLTDSDRNILTVLARAVEPLTYAEIARKAGNSPDTVRKRMGVMMRAELVTNAGGYLITSKGRAAVG